jgi:hypothetical protein
MSGMSILETFLPRCEVRTPAPIRDILTTDSINTLIRLMSGYYLKMRHDFFPSVNERASLYNKINKSTVCGILILPWLCVLEVVSSILSTQDKWIYHDDLFAESRLWQRAALSVCCWVGLKNTSIFSYHTLSTGVSCPFQSWVHIRLSYHFLGR